MAPLAEQPAAFERNEEVASVERLGRNAKRTELTSFTERRHEGSRGNA